MIDHSKLAGGITQRRFAFDYERNTILFKSSIIHLSPHEADILYLLLKHRARVTPLAVLIHQVYGVTEPITAATSIRVAVHSLRKKLEVTGLKIRAEARVGYEIDAEDVPELDLGLSDLILSAFNVAQALGAPDIADRLQAMLIELAASDKARRQRGKYRHAVEFGSTH